MTPEAWVILDEKEIAFLSRGGTVGTLAQDGATSVRISYFPEAPEPDQLELPPSPNTTEDREP